MDARVVSNDEFEAYQHAYGWIEERRVPFMIIDENVLLYDSDVEQEGDT